MQHVISSHSRMDAWIVDSGAASHMCINQSGFMQHKSLKKTLKVTLGDGYEVDAVGCGTVVFYSELPYGKSRKCKLHDVLHVPQLSYDLFSVSVATAHEKTMCFGEKTVKSLIKASLSQWLLKWGNFTISNI